MGVWVHESTEKGRNKGICILDSLFRVERGREEGKDKFEADAVWAAVQVRSPGGLYIAPK